MSGQEIQFGIKITADSKEAVGAAKDVQSAYVNLGQATEQLNAKSGQQVLSADAIAAGNKRAADALRAHSAAMATTSGDVSKLLDKYDPLSAKLKQLQADFKALDDAARKGQVGGRDDSRLDSVYAKLKAEIKSTQAAMDGAGDAATASFGKIAAGIAAMGGSIVLAKSAAHALIDTQLQLEKSTRLLQFATGSAQSAGEAYRFIAGQANALGLELNTTAAAFGKFSAATRGTELEGQKARDIFTGVSKAASTFGLTSDETSGAFLALTQMIGKGVVSAEEFRGQLAERIPVATQVAADALGVTTAQFGKMLESGEIVASEFLPLFAKRLEELASSGGMAADGLQQEINRLANSWTQLKQTVNDSGVGNLIKTEISGLGVLLQGVRGEIEGTDRSLRNFLANAALMAAGAVVPGLGEIGRRRMQNPEPGMFDDPAAARSSSGKIKGVNGEAAAVKDLTSAWADYDKALGGFASKDEKRQSDREKAVTAYARMMKAAAGDAKAQAEAQEKLNSALKNIDAASGKEGASKAAAAAKKAASEASAAAKKDATEEEAVMAKLLGYSASYLKDLAAAQRLRDEGKISTEDHTALVQKLYLTETEGGKAVAKAAEDAAKRKNRAIDEYIERLNKQKDLEYDAIVAVTAYTKGLQETAQARELELSLMFASEAARATALEQNRIELDFLKQKANIEAKILDLDKRAAQLALARSAANTAKAQSASYYAAKEAADGMKEFWGTLDRTAHDTWISIANGGKDTATRLKETFNNVFFDWFYQMGKQQLVLNVSANMSGGVGMAGWPGGSPGMMNGAGAANSIYNAGTSAAGGYVTAAGNSLGIAAVSQVGQGMSLGFSGLSDLAAISGATPAASMYIGAALPWVGAALALASMTGMFDHKGGPKSGGFATTSTNGVTDFARTYTPNTNDADVSKTVAIAQSTYAAVAARFGATGAAKFSLGYDTDPDGTASNRYTYEGSVGGKTFSARDVSDGRGDAAGTVAKGMNAMLLDAFKATDMGPIANAIVFGATVDMLPKVQAALSGAADLFAPALSPMQAAMQAAAATSAALAINLAEVGVTGDVSTAAIKSTVMALDLTSAAGQDAARAILALEPATRAYEASLGEIFGITAQSLQSDLFDAIKNSPDAASAGDAFASAITGGLKDALLGSYTAQLADMMYTGVITPVLAGVMKGQTLAQILADGAVEAAIVNIKKTAAIYKQVMDDPRVKDILAGFDTGARTLGTDLYQPGYYVAPDAKVDKTADDAAKTAADNARDLKKQMADVAYQMQTLGMDSLGKSLLDAAKATTDAIASAKLLGATETDLQKIRLLGIAQTKKMLDDAAIAAYRNLDTAQGGALQAKYDPANARADHATAMSGLASSLGVSGDVLETLIAQSGGLLQAGIKYWSGLSDAQKQAAIKAVDSQTALATATQKAFDAQLSKVTQIQGWIDRVKGFEKGVDASIFDIQLSQAKDGGVGMLKGKEAGLWSDFNTYGAGVDPATMSDADVQHQIDLAGDLEGTIIRRYQIEISALQKVSGFVQNLSDHVKTLKLGDLSPLTIPQKVAEAKAQYDAIKAVLRDPNASAADTERAQGKFTGAQDAYLGIFQKYTASGQGYTDLFNQLLADSATFGADAQTDAQRQIGLLTAMSGKASDTIRDLGLLKTAATQGLGALGGLLQPELAKLGTIANTLGEQGILGQLKTLPAGIAAALNPYLEAGNRPAAIAATAAGNAPYVATTAASKGSNFTPVDIKDSVLRWYGTPAPGGETAALRAVYDWAVNRGVKSEQIDASFGNPAGTAAALALKNGWPAFAAGGDHLGGLRIVGERGPELEATGASRIFNADDTRRIFSGGGQDNSAMVAVVAKLQVLIEEVEKLREDNARLAGMLASVTAQSSEDAAAAVVKAVEGSATTRQNRAGAVLL